MRPESTLAPLFPLEASTGATVIVTGAVRETPVSIPWNHWTGVQHSPQNPTSKRFRPNPATNRPEVQSQAFSVPLYQQLTTTAELAQAMQQTATRVAEAHALFLKSREQALEQIMEIASLLQHVANTQEH
jgi:hypothetical protein